MQAEVRELQPVERVPVICCQPVDAVGAVPWCLGTPALQQSLALRRLAHRNTWPRNGQKGQMKVKDVEKMQVNEPEV